MNTKKLLLFGLLVAMTGALSAETVLQKKFYECISNPNDEKCHGLRNFYLSDNHSRADKLIHSLGAKLMEWNCPGTTDQLTEVINRLRQETGKKKITSWGFDTTQFRSPQSAACCKAGGLPYNKKKRWFPRFKNVLKKPLSMINFKRPWKKSRSHTP